MHNRVKLLGIRGILGVIGASEVRQIACESGVSEFTSEATLYAVGVPEDILPAELDLIGDTFVGTYNLVADQSCDASFKSVKSAKILVVVDYDSSSHDVFDGRQLQQPRNIRQFKLRVMVSGSCKMCSKEVLLFNDAIRRHLLPYEHVGPESAELSGRQLGFLGSPCWLRSTGSCHVAPDHRLTEK